MTSVPYLSIVAAARNDNHGGNMLRRMQIFISGVITQARRYQVPIELIIWLVEQGFINSSTSSRCTGTGTRITPEVDLTPPLPYAKLHTITCGDFTLLSKTDCLAIRGYAEWEMYSFHLDSILLYTAHYAGIEEEILNDDMRAYHIEHFSGWTPEAERSQVLDNRLSSLGIPKLTMEQLDAIARLMEQLGKPILFNDENWGLNQHTLPETVIAPAIVQH